jgi:two-component system, NtrC family, response regulator PilR
MSVVQPPSSSRILVIDDEPDLRTLYEMSLVREGYAVQTAATVAEAQSLLNQQRFDAVITDMRLPDGLGLEVLRRLVAEQRSERCVVMTAYGSAENAVEALKAGAFDYLTKPVDLKQFRAVVASATQHHAQLAVQAPATDTAGDRPQRVATASKSSWSSPATAASKDDGAQALARLVGESAAMHAVRERIRKVANSMAPVLVHGESGTGKELVARSIHACSHRNSGPFVAVNCGAIPDALLEAEFFGARKGSYTGSTQDRPGYFQAAQGGTLFLDEIGDLPLAMQSKLLRAIQERCVRALGSLQEEVIDARIVSATHHDLALAVKQGRFRQDLYYRINVIEIAIPALRERREDLPLLCNALLERIAQETGQSVGRMTPQFLQALQRQPLQGNVRELENLLHRAVALSDGVELGWSYADAASSR